MSGIQEDASINGHSFRSSSCEMPSSLRLSIRSRAAVVSCSISSACVFEICLWIEEGSEKVSSQHCHSGEASAGGVGTLLDATKIAKVYNREKAVFSPYNLTINEKSSRDPKSQRDSMHVSIYLPTFLPTNILLLMTTNGKK